MPNPPEFPQLSTNEFNALHDFYNSTNGLNWIWRNITEFSIPWNFSEPNADPCHDRWQGLSCDCNRTSCSIEMIYLNRHNLTGTLPDSIGSFQQMRSLRLRQNNITGTITQSLGNLLYLERLDLGYNFFTGMIPSSIGRLTNLSSLFLGNNYLTSIPEELYQLQRLESINLFNNNLQGLLTSNIGNLTNLKALELQINDFSSQLIPTGLCELKLLETLDLSQNLFHGPIPDCFWDITSLKSISFYSTNMSCPLSPKIGNLINVESIDFSFSHFFGPIPESIGNLSKLTSVALQYNFFTGSLPKSLVNLPRLRYFFLQNNYLHGSLPFLGNLASTLNVLFFRDNFFTGSLPLQTNQLTNLDYFEVSGNLMTGMLPWNPEWRKIFIYEAFDNYFSQTLPSSNMAVATRLLYFLAPKNYLTGSIPDQFLSTSHELFYLDLSENLLTNSLPVSLGNFSALNQLLLSNNFFTGGCPQLRRDIFLVVLDLSYNQLKGTLPSSLASLRFLEELFLQSNQFSGAIDAIFNSSIQHRFVNIDLSGNQFTGTIPTTLFLKSPLLVSFVASSNCLDGSIPEEICQAPTLVSLSLDGLTTAENCQELFFTDISSFNAFTVSHFIQGTIPNCLFQMPSLELLHLSGNGLTGSIPNYLNLSQSLNDLSLSHNSLTGTIPTQIQLRSWLNLDLSYNKLSGTLESSFATPNLYGSVSLQVNRLSGRLPSSLLHWDNLTVLNGNIFGCNSLENDLPSNDPDASNYSCGSDAANDVLYAWIGSIACLTLILFAFAIKRWKSIRNSWTKLLSWQQQLRKNPSRHNLIRLSIYFSEIRRSTWILAVYCLVVLIPVYLILKIDFSSYQVEYAWSISGLLMNGTVAAIALFIVLGILVTFYYIIIKRLLSRIEQKMPRPSHRKTEIAGRMTKSIITASQGDSGESSSFSQPSSSTSAFPIVESTSTTVESNRSQSISMISEDLLEVLAVYFFVGMIDVVIMTFTDFSYVYIVINYDAAVVSLAALALALFRLATNHLILWYALPRTSYCLHWIKKLCSRQSQQRQMSSVTKKFITLDYTSRDISFLENLTLVNNIIIPGIAIIFILPDCFYNALYAADAVSSSYSYYSCYQYAPVSALSHICYNHETTMSYSPPYIYSFQCSSKIVINYVPVYVLMFIVAGIIIPLLKIMFKLWYDYLLRLETENEKDKSRDKSSKGIIMIRNYLEKILPEHLKELRPHESHTSASNGNQQTLSNASLTLVEDGGPIETESKTENDVTPSLLQLMYHKKLFSKLTMTVQINSYLTILMCFGALFPPLAIIAAISIYTLTYYEELWMGRMLEKIRTLGIGYEWYEEQLDQESEGVEESSNFTLWSTLMVSCSLYGYIIFDTMGDQLGWEAALPMTLVMVLFPLWLWVGGLGYLYWGKVKKDSFLRPCLNRAGLPNTSRNNQESKEDLDILEEKDSLSSINPIVRHSSIQMVSTDKLC